jgi:hypothetical protein
MMILVLRCGGQLTPYMATDLMSMGGWTRSEANRTRGMQEANGKKQELPLRMEEILANSHNKGSTLGIQIRDQ